MFFPRRREADSGAPGDTLRRDSLSQVAMAGNAEGLLIVPQTAV